MLKRIIIVCLTLCLLTGCTMVVPNKIYGDDKKIAENTDSYTTTDSVMNQKKLSAGATIGTIKGMRTMWSHTVKADTQVDITTTMTVGGGKAKLVLIYPDDTITVLTEIDTATDDVTEKTATESVTLPEGKSRIKVVAADGEDLDISISATEHSAS